MNRKLSFALAITILLTPACQKAVSQGSIDPDEGNPEAGQTLCEFTTPASTSTRMIIDYNSDETGWQITKSWNEGDSLIGFVKIGDGTAEYKYFTYVCSDITDNTATWTRVSQSSCAGYPKNNVSADLHMAYAPGISASEFASGGQTVISGIQIPIACGTGQYDPVTGKLDITFANRTAMLCLVSPSLSGVSSKTTIDHIEIRGICTAGTLGLSENTMEMIPNEDSVGVSSYYPPAGGSWTTDDAGKLDCNIFLPVIPGANLEESSIKVVTASGDCFFYNIAKNTTMSATSYRINQKSFTGVEAEYKIGGGIPKTATTVQEAFSAANNAQENVTITLQKDITLTDSLEFTNSEAELTLDLNGKSLTANNKTTMHPALKMGTTGCIVNISDGSAAGNGKIDQKYGGTGYTIVIKAGTLNISGGTVCNSSSNGYGRIALNIGDKSGTAPATVNISGGYIYGGRTIFLGPGKSGALATLNVTGGKIEGKYNSTSDIYAAIYVDDYSRTAITGGSIISSKAPCIYVRNDMSDVEVVLGSQDGANAPYLFTGGHTQCINAGNESQYKEAAYKKYKLFRSYWNKNVLEYPDLTDASVSTLSPAITYDGRTYSYLVKASSSANTQPVQDGDTSDWF